MSCGDKFDERIDLLCVCESYWKCEWHERLDDGHETRCELGEEMDDIIGTSHAIHMGVMDPPEGWELIQGSRRKYWAPANRGY